jgi:transposase InsO family protein
MKVYCPTDMETLDDETTEEAASRRDRWEVASRGRMFNAGKALATVVHTLEASDSTLERWRRGHRREAVSMYIEPGSPCENGYAESFNGRLRDELVAMEIFDGVRDARDLSVFFEARIQHPAAAQLARLPDRGQVRRSGVTLKTPKPSPPAMERRVADLQGPLQC